jgi:hypothetical protein
MSWCCPERWQLIPFLGNGVGGRKAAAPHYSIDNNINEKWENIKTIIKETKQSL